MPNKNPLNLNQVLANAPIKEDLKLESDDEKIDLIKSHFKEVMKAFGLNLSDDSLRDTPERVAKMYVKENFSGLNPENKPKISLFDNK